MAPFQRTISKGRNARCVAGKSQAEPRCGPCRKLFLNHITAFATHARDSRNYLRCTESVRASATYGTYTYARRSRSPTFLSLSPSLLLAHSLSFGMPWHGSFPPSRAAVPPANAIVRAANPSGEAAYNVAILRTIGTLNEPLHHP